MHLVLYYIHIYLDDWLIKSSQIYDNELNIYTRSLGYIIYNLIKRRVCIEIQNLPLKQTNWHEWRHKQAHVV